MKKILKGKKIDFESPLPHFAGGMIPTDTAFFNNVKQEVIEQIERQCVL
jgi:hypothetical protein